MDSYKCQSGNIAQLELAANDSHNVVGIATLLHSSSAMSLRPSSALIMHEPDAQSHDVKEATDPISSEVPGQQHHGHGMSDKAAAAPALHPQPLSSQPEMRGILRSQQT